MGKYDSPPDELDHDVPERPQREEAQKPARRRGAAVREVRRYGVGGDHTQGPREQQALNVLRNRKYDEELQTWLRQIRDEAYVEIKLPGADQATQ